MCAASSKSSLVAGSKSGGYSYVPSRICCDTGPSARCPISSKNVPRWHGVINADWNLSTKIGLTAEKRLSLVLNSLCPPSAVETLTRRVRLPRALRVDLLMRFHHFFIASFCIIPAIFDTRCESPD